MFPELDVVYVGNQSRSQSNDQISYYKMTDIYAKAAYYTFCIWYLIEFFQSLPNIFLRGISLSNELHISYLIFFWIP